MVKLVYCATPARLASRIKDIMDSVTSEGNAPLHPFQALPYERFEGNPVVGRKNAMLYRMRLIDISDEFRMFGISKGVLDELSHARTLVIPVTLKLDFDPDWRKHYDELAGRYGRPLDGFLGTHS